MVLVMSVFPGFGGQSFISDVLVKVSEIRDIIDKNHYNCLIEIDGGINPQTALAAKKAGCDVLVAGSSVFGAKDAAKAISDLRYHISTQNYCLYYNFPKLVIYLPIMTKYINYLFVV